MRYHPETLDPCCCDNCGGVIHHNGFRKRGLCEDCYDGMGEDYEEHRREMLRDDDIDEAEYRYDDR